jgi:hypothetical protein
MAAIFATGSVAVARGNYNFAFRVGWSDQQRWIYRHTSPYGDRNITTNSHDYRRIAKYRTLDFIPGWVN